MKKKKKVCRCCKSPYLSEVKCDDETSEEEKEYICLICCGTTCCKDFEDEDSDKEEFPLA